MRNRTAACRFPTTLLIALLLLVRATPAPAAGESLKGDPLTVDDATAYPIELDAKLLLPCLTWADLQGNAFYACDGNGVLRLISFPDFKEVKKKDFERKVAWIALTGEGLMLSMPDPQEAWLLDTDSWDVKKKIAVPFLRRAVGSPVSSLGAAFGGNQQDNRLYLLDLKKGKAVPYVPPTTVPLLDLGNHDPMMSPDGKYVFCRGHGTIVRYGIVQGKLKYQETSPHLEGGALGAGIQVSPDSKYVCLPNGAGNGGASYSTYVYPVANVKRPECTLESGPYPQAVGFDPAGGWVYAQGNGKSLILFTFTGIKKKEYKIGDAHNLRQYLAHPKGNQLLMLTDQQLWAVDVPRKN
jgi:hypothetical protein